MNAPIILNQRAALLSETINNAVGMALLHVKSRSGMSLQTMAERLGKNTRQSAASYISGETEMGVSAFLMGGADPELGDEFLNEVLRLIGRRVVPLGAQQVDLDALACDMSAALSELLRAWKDRRLSAKERQRLRAILKPLIASFEAVIAEDA